ncbi:hypothetical protein N5D52_25245 [Pseudomonas sp. GD03860]|uniref:hypothetical protein n=1 Tax=Pseudomonas TaxID=286 RepID=UPI002363A03C|nr:MULTISPECIES: hypothetical protein [Pseudomonas]MDD2058428.1 hypothetical protein [Pseudomonas putida]MDH0640240.1 hypothetical protein [Pseudomonas sp. GD03860]
MSALYALAGAVLLALVACSEVYSGRRQYEYPPQTQQVDADPPAYSPSWFGVFH